MKYKFQLKLGIGIFFKLVKTFITLIFFFTNNWYCTFIKLTWKSKKKKKKVKTYKTDLENR